jgi:hypothetical protein
MNVTISKLSAFEPTGKEAFSTSKMIASFCGGKSRITEELCP